MDKSVQKLIFFKRIVKDWKELAEIEKSRQEFVNFLRGRNERKEMARKVKVGNIGTDQ